MGILSSIGRFLFGGPKEVTTNTTQTQDPYGPTRPYIDSYLRDTAGLYNGGTPMFSDMEQDGYSILRSIAQGGPSQLFKTAEQSLTDTAGGKFLTPDTNPYLADIAKRIAGIAGSNVTSTFGSGRANSGLAGYYSGKGVADSLTDLFGSVYNTERGNMMQAAGMAPTFERARFDTPQAMISAGQNISGRPFDLNQQYGGILSNIAQLGGTATVNGKQTTHSEGPGLIGGAIKSAFNSLTNKLFPTGG